MRDIIRNMTLSNSSDETIALAGMLRELCYCRDGVFDMQIDIDFSCLSFFIS